MIIFFGIFLYLSLGVSSSKSYQPSEEPREPDIPAVPRKWFGSADCIQSDRYLVHIVSQSADPNHFRLVGELDRECCQRVFNIILNMGIVSI